MTKNRFIHKKLVCAVTVCGVLMMVACAPKNNGGTGNEVLVETEVTGTEVETQVQESESEYSVTDFEYNGETSFVSSEYLADEKVSSWVVDMDVAETASQVIVVAADGSNATVSMHIKEEDGIWTEILSTDGKIGRNGIDKTKEGDGKTPTGVYHFMFGFGNMPDPGCGLSYTQVDDSYYWVDDSDSAYYNQFVTTNEVTKDWNSAEHIVSVKNSYNYVLALDYNVDCVPGAGSAIFMHCTPTGGAGCIAVPEDKMVEIMRNVKEGCVVVIDSVEGICREE